MTHKGSKYSINVKAKLHDNHPYLLPRNNMSVPVQCDLKDDIDMNKLGWYIRYKKVLNFEHFFVNFALVTV